MTPSLTHVLLTRFNLPTPGVESMVRAKDGWLRERQELFERFCLPSVQAQSKSEFNWIVYFDTQSPPWLKARVAELAMSGTFAAIYRDSVPRTDLLSDIREVAGDDTDVLLTTNLDNDDAVAHDFVERLQAQVGDGGRCAIYLSNGLIRSGMNLYRRHDPHNAFASVSENWSGAVTCWSDWHDRLGGSMDVRPVGGEPGWLQVVHNGNVSNRIKGTLVGPEKYLRLFPCGLDGVATPTTASLIVDRGFWAPLRAAREMPRAIAKKMILLIGGKKGLDRIKVLVAGRSRV